MLARMRFPKLEWVLISEYMHIQADTRYNVKVFKTATPPKKGDNRKQYQVIANNCSRAGDSGRLQLRKLPC